MHEFPLFDITERIAIVTGRTGLLGVQQGVADLCVVERRARFSGAWQRGAGGV